MIETDFGTEAAALEAIGEMSKSYQKGFETAREHAARDLYYPGINIIVAQLAARAGAAQPALDAALVAEVRASFDAKRRDDPDFWSVAGSNELLLLEALSEGTLPGKVAAVVGEFADLQRRISTTNYWRSVYDTERFVLERWTKGSAEPNAQAKACDDVLAQLKRYAWPAED